MRSSSSSLSLPDEYIDADRLRRMAGGEVAALRELYNTHGGRVFGFAQRMVRDAGEAEEITQDVFVRAWQRAVHYDPKRASPAGWLLMMTRSLAIDRLRRRRARPHEIGCVELGNERLAPNDTSGEAEALLAALRPVERTCLMAVFVEGRTHEEAAVATGLPLGSVKTHVRRGLLKLRELLRHDAS